MYVQYVLIYLIHLVYLLCLPSMFETKKKTSPKGWKKALFEAYNLELTKWQVSFKPCLLNSWWERTHYAPFFPLEFQQYMTMTH